MNYSIIIPHKNIPTLLQRCINSIPQIEGVEVIIIDDNSDPSIVDFNNFPGKNRKDITIYFSKEGNGAGYARNLGLEKASGKWLLFMDSDDLFSNNLTDILNEVLNAKEDIIFTKVKFVDSNNIQQEIVRSGSETITNHINSYLIGNKNEYYLRYDFPALWGKIIRSSIVRANKIKFDEVQWSNDIYFSTCLGRCADSITVLNKDLYISTLRPGSLTYKFLSSNKEIVTRLLEAIKSDKIIKESVPNSNPPYTRGILHNLYSRTGQLSFLKTMILNIDNWKVFSTMFIYYFKSRTQLLCSLYNKLISKG